MKNKEPKVFLQSRPTTCGVACLMMILNIFRGLPLTKAEEGRLRKKLKLNRFDLIPAISLAMYLKRQGFEISVRHDDPVKFWKRIESFGNEDLTSQLQKKHLISKEAGLIIEPGHVSAEEIVAKLENSLIILGTETASGIKHAILLYGIQDNIVKFIDPLVGQLSAPLDVVLRGARMDVGTWYISAFCPETTK